MALTTIFIRPMAVLLVLILVGCERDGAGDALSTNEPGASIRSATDTAAAAPSTSRANPRAQVRRSLDEALVRAELQRRGTIVSDEQADVAWDAYVKRLGPEALNRLLATGATVEELQYRVRVRLEFDTLVKDDTEAPITDEQIRSFYLSNLSRYVVQESFVAREIFLSTSGERSQSRRLTDMRRIAAELEEGTEFAVLARRYSESPSASRGGSTVRLTSDAVDPEVWRVLSSIEVGQHQVVTTSRGVHLLQLAARIAAREVPRGQVRDEIVRNLQAKRRSNAVNQTVSSLRAQAEQADDYQTKRLGLGEVASIDH